MPLELSVGVRYQRAPSKRSARAFWTPAVSAPASGCPPMKRSSSPRAATSWRLVEPASVTTVSGPLAASASRTRSGRTETGEAQKTTSASAQASSTVAAVRSTPPRSAARSSVAARGPQPITSAPSFSRAARPIEPPIGPTPSTAALICRPRSSIAPRPHRRREALEHPDRVVPGHAWVGDRLPVGEVRSVAEGLVALDQEGLEHDAHDRRVPLGHLVGDQPRRLELLLGVLFAVVVGGVDDQPLGQLRLAEQLQRRGDAVVVAVGAAPPAAQ